MSKLSLSVQGRPTGPADLRRPSKVIGDVVVIDQPILAVVPATDGRDLDQIAESIWAHWVSTEDDRFSICRDVWEARQRFLGDREFGVWFKAQGFPFGRQTLYVYLQAARNEEAVRVALSNQLNSGKAQNFAKAVRSVVYPNVDPADAPPEQPKKGKPIGAKTTKTDAIRHMRGIEMTLSILTPSDVVPGAKPLIREFAGRLIAWASQWSESDASASQDEGDSSENDVRGPDDLAG